MDEVAQLEQAILDRARDIAEQQRAQTQQAVRHLQAENAQRLQRHQQREQNAAHAAGERAYRGLVQAGELRMRAELDQLRWHLIEQVLTGLNPHLELFCHDSARYTAWLKELIRHSVVLIEQDNLEVEVNQHDYTWLNQEWSIFTREVLPDKILRLIAAPDDHSLGGVRVYTPDHRITVDNRIMERMRLYRDEIFLAVFNRLFVAI